jgi:hypothetical protein
MYIDKTFFLVYTWKTMAWSEGYNMIFLLVITKVINSKYIVKNFTRRLNTWYFVIGYAHTHYLQYVFLLKKNSSKLINWYVICTSNKKKTRFSSNYPCENLFEMIY